MASRSLGELLLRPSPWTRILPSAPTWPAAPSPTSSLSPCCPRLRRITASPPSWTARRSIASTRSPYVPAQPQSKQVNEDGQDPRPFGLHGATPEPPRRASQHDASQAIDSLLTEVAGTGIGKGTRGQPPPPLFRPAHAQPPSSGDDIGAARQAHIFGSDFSSASPGSRRPLSLDFDAMALPDGIMDPSLANKTSDAAAAFAARQEEIFANYPRLNATYGRMVELDPARGRDLVRGIGMLGSLTARNKIKGDHAKQRFHERGGLKRKRLLSERWRARFRAGFRQLTSRVSELTRKGW